jgi:hypothetical protein
MKKEEMDGFIPDEIFYNFLFLLFKIFEFHGPKAYSKQNIIRLQIMSMNSFINNITRYPYFIFAP